MKYEEPIKLENNEVHSMILQKIKKGSKVLEFGPAAGRMTKILTEEYRCKVSIVEYEKEAFQSVMRYADDGICADIENYEWKKWSGAEFDYILFCDVLEHLRNPKQVLKETQHLLKNDGSVFLSLPNIGHNDILIKLYHHTFEYTEEGLLDDTHIRFFSEHTLESFVENTGYVIVNKQYKTIAKGMTEQFWKEEFVCPNILARALRKRANGDVYQFVLELKKDSSDVKYQKTYEKAHYMPIDGLIYFDRGHGFSQDDVKEIIGTRVQEDTYEFYDEIILDKNIKKLRLDPVERGLCQVVSMECSLGNAYMPHKILIDKKKIIMDADPQIIWNVPDETKSVSLHAIIYVNEDELLNQTIRYCRLIEKRKDIFERDHKRNASHIDELEQKNLEYGNRILSLEKQKIQQENHVSVLEQQKTQQENNISVLKKQLVQQENDIAVLQQQKKNFTEKIFSKEKELYAITHSRSWKCTAFLRKMNTWMKRKRS